MKILYLLKNVVVFLKPHTFYYNVARDFGGFTMLCDLLYKLGSNIVRYFNHHLFLCVRSNCEIVPTGLALKKIPCITKISHAAMSRWNSALQDAGNILVMILKGEYRNMLRYALIEFWNLVPTILESAQGIFEIFTKLLKTINYLHDEKEKTRSRKLLRLFPSIDILNLPLYDVEEFTFFNDLCYLIEPMCQISTDITLFNSNIDINVDNSASDNILNVSLLRSESTITMNSVPQVENFETSGTEVEYCTQDSMEVTATSGVGVGGGGGGRKLRYSYRGSC